MKCFHITWASNIYMLFQILMEGVASCLDLKFPKLNWNKFDFSSTYRSWSCTSGKGQEFDILNISTINSLCLALFSWNMKIYFHFCNFSTLRWYKCFKSFLVVSKELFILLCQYHGCWCLGDASRQGISSHDVDRIMKHSTLSTRRVKLPLSWPRKSSIMYNGTKLLVHLVVQWCIYASVMHICIIEQGHH